MPSHAPFTLPLFVPSLSGTGGGELCFTSTAPGRGAETTFVDVSRWPPRLIKHPGGALDAARSRSGRWLVLTWTGKSPPFSWRLRTFAPGGAAGPARDVAEPFPPLPGQEEDSAVAQVCFVGERALIVPRSCGTAGRDRPWIERDGVWVEERGLPAYTRPADDEEARPAAYAASLADGGDVLIWDGYCFEHDGRGFARTFEQRLDTPWYHSFHWAPAGRDGFFYLSGGSKLMEVHRGGQPPREHLPGIELRSIAAGPDGTLVLWKDDDDVLLYDPAEGTVAAVPRELLPDRRELRFVGWSEGGFLVTLHDPDDPGQILSAVPRAELEALPRERASSVKPPVRDASAALAGGRAASRPLLAAHVQTGTIFIAHGRELRAHTFDDPQWRETWDDEIIALAADDRYLTVLDARGLIHGLVVPERARTAGVNVGARPRSLAMARNATMAVLDAGGAQLVDESGPRRLPFEAPLCAAFDGPAARLLITGERRRAALITVATGAVEALPAPPEELHAVMWLAGDMWLALGERSLLRFDAQARTFTTVRAMQTGDHLARSPAGTRVAVATGPRGLEVLDADTLEVQRTLTYPEMYQSSKEQIAITGLAFLDERRLVVGLTRGNANILDLKKGMAFKMDEPPGTPHDRWVFIYDGNILIAG